MYSVLVLIVLAIAQLAYAQDTQAPQVGAVQGLVLDSDRKPLAGATVYGMAEKNMLKQLRTVTDQDGKFLLTGLPVGNVYLNAFKESAGYPYNFFSFFISPGQEDPGKVVVRPDATTSGVVIKLGARAAHINFEITDENGKPVNADADFDRDDMPGPYSRGVLSNQSLLVPPVPFRLTVVAAGYGPWHYGGEKWQTDEGLIKLRSGETLNLSIRLKRSP